MGGNWHFQGVYIYPVKEAVFKIFMFTLLFKAKQ
jgi:hypothetical protein